MFLIFNVSGSVELLAIESTTNFPFEDNKVYFNFNLLASLGHILNYTYYTKLYTKLKKKLSEPLPICFYFNVSDLIAI